MKSVHLIIPDLFLPGDIAPEVCAGMHLPALERILTRGHSSRLQEEAGLEKILCETFGVSLQSGVPVAPISALFDGLGEGCWLRADPVHLRLQRDRLMLLPVVQVSEGEAVQLCAALNGHFAGQGMEFIAPHPQRWYMRLDRLPDIETVTLSQAAGRNVNGLLPKGAEAPRWHQLFNEIQMLLFSHPLNEAREARGELPVNSLWFFGAGCSPDVTLQRIYDSVSSDEALAEMLASAAYIPFTTWPEKWRNEEGGGKQLLVWTGLSSALQRGDLESWRTALRDFEAGYAQPLWQALLTGNISHLQLDVPGRDNVLRLSLKRSDAWAFWRRARPLARYSMGSAVV